VYKVISRHKPAKKWDELVEQAEGDFIQPKAVHEQWHTDFSHIKIRGSFYYFISILDGYSRRILNWRLCGMMEGINAEALVTETRELYPEVKNPCLISDNGSRFIHARQPSAEQWKVRTLLPDIKNGTYQEECL
jgi:transposase InsO family protein